jgi:hypothetical protein
LMWWFLRDARNYSYGLVGVFCTISSFVPNNRFVTAY